ncbi:RHS repeat-associated core domain-containing protein [Nonomuraea sp. NPDC003727]
MSELSGYQGPVTTPKQMAGTSGVLPPLVDVSATQARTGSTGPRNAQKIKLPKGALGLDNRAASKALPEDPKPPKLWIPRDKRKQEMASAVDERAVQTASADAPWIGPAFPENQAQVDTLTPQLRANAYGRGTSAWWQVEREYKVCELTASGTVGTCHKSAWKPWTDPFWKVPAGKLQWGKTYVWEVQARDTNTMETGLLGNLRFTTGVRQPMVSSLLATRGVNGQEFHQLAGNYTTAFTDASVATPGAVPLSVVRSYNSLDRRAKAMFGAGWSTRFDMKIESEGGTLESLLLTSLDGRQLRFTQKSGTNSYQSPPGMHFTLAKLTGGGWRLMDKTSTVYEFDGQGRLLKMTDSRGRGQDLTYTDGKLTKVTATGGRSLSFAWLGDHVSAVSTDPVDGKALTWTYHYEGDRLAEVCSPVAEPNCTSYTYTSGSRYRETVLDSRPVHYFRLGEVRTEEWPEMGTVKCFPDDADSLGCQMFGTGVLTGQSGALAGTTNAAATFQGSGRSSHFDLGPTLPRLGDQVTIESWFKTTKSGFIYWAGRSEWNVSAPGYGVPALYVGTDGKLRGQLKLALGAEAPATPVTSPQAVNDGQWHHAAITVANNVTTLYVDGATAGTGAMGVEDWDWIDGSVIGSGAADSTVPGTPAGRSQSTEFGFEGSIDEFALYDRALTPGEVRAHYEARAEAPFSLTKITLPSGRAWMSSTYDAASGRLATYTDPHGGTWKVGTPTLDYTKWLDTVTVTDPRGGTLTSEHDAWRGQRLVSEIDQLGKKISYAYDTGGFPAKITDRNGNVLERTFDKRGNALSSKTCWDLSRCQTSYSEYHVDEQNEFDPRNDRMTVARDARSSSYIDNTYATKWEFNALGEVVKETTPATADFPNGRSTAATYTDGSEAAIGGGTMPAGLVASRTDARGNTWTYRYTAAGDLAEQTDPAGLVTKLSYDALGRLIDSTQVSQAHPGGVKSTFTYDELSRPLTQTEPGVKNETTNVTHTRRTTLAYDADGNKLSEKVSDLTGGDAERSTVYTYDALGRVETITGPEGGVVRQSWNTLGQLVRVTDARGTVVEHGYSNRGELTTRTLKGWTGSPVSPTPAKDVVLESFSYDPGGRLEAQVDAMGRKTSYTYFGDNRLATKTAKDVKLNGSTTPRDVVLENHTYDAAGNRTKLVTGGGTATTEFVFDAAARLTSQTFDPGVLSRKTAFTYDANGNVLKTTLTGAGTARAEVTEYAYNKVNQVTKTTVENGDEDIVSTSTYDDRGLLTSTTDPRGNVSGANEADFTSTMRYDLLGRPVEVTGPQVKVDKAGTSSTAHPSARLGYDTFGATTHETDAEGRTVTSVFNKAGRLTSKTAPSYTPPGGTAITPTTTNAYDPAGQLIRTTDPRGYVTTFEYDQLGRQVRITDPAPEGETAGRWVTEYDLAGEKLAGIDPTGARVEATYDDLGRKITVTQVERKPTSAAYTTTQTYNDAGYLTKTVAPGNRSTSLEVNAAGEVIESKPTSVSYANKMAYDPAGRLLKVTDPLGNATVAEYDLAGRKTSVKDLNAAGTVLRTTGYGYDAAGNPNSTTSPEGRITRQTFDALNRATSLIEPVSADKSITTSFGYDASGARTRLTDGRGNATWTSYNSLGLQETVTEPATTAHPNLADRTWTSIYDAAGNQVSLVQPGGVRIDRTFDHLGRLTKESGTGAETSTSDRTFGYDLASRQTSFGNQAVEFNDRGLITKITEGSVQRTAYSYNELGMPSQRVDAAGTANFTWDNVGRLATGSDPVTGRTLTYGYDNADRLTSITPTSGQAGTQTYTYDALDRVETHTLKNGSGAQLSKITYGWDKDDNLTSKVTAGLAGAGSNTYGYDHAGRLTSWTAPGGTTTSYEWDASGNRTKAGDKTFTYDERNRITSGDGTDYTYTARGTLATETKGGTTRNLKFNAFDQLVNDGELAYTYDALGRLTSRAKAGATQHYAYSGLANDIATITDNAGAVQAKYGRDLAGGVLGVQEGGGAVVSALTDLHGDLLATFNATALVDSTAYDPFGQVTVQAGSKRTLGYQGEYTDPDTGKVNMHARWYQPGTGTFSARDSWTLSPTPSIQANRYGYANGEPLTSTDPSGHSPLRDGYANGIPAGLPYYDHDTVVSTLQRYGISTGGGGTEFCSGNLGPCDLSGAGAWPDGALYGPGGVGQLGYRDGKRVCSMAEGGDCYQPWYIPKDVKWWNTPKELREEIMESYDPAMTDDDFTALWANSVLEALARTNKNGGAFPAGQGKTDSDWLEDLGERAKKGLDLFIPGAKVWFCQKFTGTKDCGGFAGVASKEWAKFGAKLRELAEHILKNAGLSAELVKKIIVENDIKEVEAAVRGWARANGADCARVLHGMTACGGLPDKLVPRSAITIGSVVLTDMSLKEFRQNVKLVNHEYRHNQQWYHYANKTGFWFSFAILYWIEGSNPCTNRYEKQAGWTDGGYACP